MSRRGRSATITLERQQALDDAEFIGIVGKLSMDPEIRTLAAYGSAQLGDND